MSSTQIWWTVIKVAVIVLFVLSFAGMLTWFDRRGGGLMQDRPGPNRAVIKIFGKEFRFAGLLHTAADGLKFFFKEDFMPPNADRLLFQLAPLLVMVPVIALVAAIPMADTICLPEVSRVAGGHTIWPSVPRLGTCDARVAIEGAVAPLNIGILYIFALAGQGIVGAAIAGWSSDNKFSLMGAMRAASQMVSYEVTLGLSLAGAMMVYGSVRLDDMVRWQGENAWGVFVQPVAFFLFFAAAVAETKRIPFDLPEAESELVSGYFTEYSGMKFGMFYFAEYMEVVTSSMLLVTIFLGGFAMPLLHRDGLTVEFGDVVVLHQAIPHVWMSIIGVVAFFGKTIAVCVMQAFVRWSLPRFRYDQLMKLGWRALLPLSLANVLITGVVWVAFDRAGAQVKAGLAVAADVTQALVALGLAYLVVRGAVGLFSSPPRKPWIAGSAAKLAAKLGGTPVTPMQP